VIMTRSARLVLVLATFAALLYTVGATYMT
jgi:hypothetical protein